MILLQVSIHRTTFFILTGTIIAASFLEQNYRKFLEASPLCKGCRNMEFFMVRIFPYSDWIRRETLFTQCTMFLFFPFCFEQYAIKYFINKVKLIVAWKYRKNNDKAVVKVSHRKDSEKGMRIKSGLVKIGTTNMDLAKEINQKWWLNLLKLQMIPQQWYHFGLFQRSSC